MLGILEREKSEQLIQSAKPVNKTTSNNNKMFITFACAMRVFMHGYGKISVFTVKLYYLLKSASAMCLLLDALLAEIGKNKLKIFK